MNGLDTSVVELLERVSPPPRREPDWDDVLARISEPIASAPKQRMRLVRARRRRLGVLAAVGVTAAAAVTGLVLAWPFAGSPSVLAQAAAAIGNGQVTHGVTDYGVGGSLVDLRTGKRTAVDGRFEYWYDPQRGLVGIQSFRGQPVRTFFVRPGLLQSTRDSIQRDVVGYKAALRSGAFHVTGSGVIDGVPVYWIEGKPSWQLFYPFGGGTIRKVVEQVAIAKTTYKPVYMRTEVDGHTQPGSGKRILKIETIAPQPALFARARTSPTPTAAGYNGLSTKTTLAQARAAMGRAPLVPSTTIAGLRRTWIGEPGYLSGFSSYKDQLVGVELYYGHRDPNSYGPPYQAPYISITEFPGRNAFVVEQGLGYFPNNNQAILENSTATLKTHGLYVIITASDAAHALAAAQALATS